MPDRSGQLGAEAAGAAHDQALDAAVHELFAELGTLVVLEDRQLDVAMGLMSCGPAYVALVAGPGAAACASGRSAR